MKGFLIVIASIFGWFGLAVLLVIGIKNLVTLQMKSYVFGVPMLAICVLAFWSFYSAYKKSREAGASSISQLYDVLAFRFCMTPLMVYACLMVPMFFI
ncbi:hypothetical protein [Undibacterium umbellatum]|uniref:Uncharacterized protein n=1 Tax=Undibacterium umbellatum TaxID=2762300 RepID=A0ABR6Z845_9BURK|nr:hypothetical protein [Undibacterium umbellatum]MBC3907510.1 hypothetical protein [Undibacterium umbellatum]